LKFPATFKLDVKVPVCSRVWVEERAALPMPGPYQGPPTEPVIRWEVKGHHKPRLDDAFEAAKGIKKPEDAVRFWQEHGPLLGEKEVGFFDLEHCLIVFRIFVALKDATKPKPGMPPRVRVIEEFFSPVEFAIEKRFRCTKYRFRIFPAHPDYQAAYGVKHVFQLAPAKPNDWPIFTAPDKWPKTREEIIAYAQREISRNVLNRLSRVKIAWGRSGIVISPSSLFDAMLAKACLEEPRLTEKKPPSTKAKHDALRYFHSYRSRGKITEAQFFVAKKAILQAWDKGERDLKRLREEGHNALRGSCGLLKN